MRKLTMQELGRKTVEEFKQSNKIPVVAVLDNVRSMHYVGSVFRTADGFLLHSVILCGYTAQPPHRDIQKTALGATESVDWIYFEKTMDAITALKERGYKIFGIEQAERSISLEKFEHNNNEPVAVVFGNEVEGVQ